MQLVKRISQFSLFVLLLMLSSCQRYGTSKELVNDGNTYFSIKQYALDQVQMFGGVPHSLYRIVHLDGKVDSTITNFINMDWASIFQIFGASDISPKKFIGQYDFASYDDDATSSRGLIYTAKREYPNLLTRTLQINADPSNNKITSIYIETAKSDFWGSTRQRLLYVPLRVIQIQEEQHGLLGKARKLRVDYRFMRDDEIE
jgi:hypothetical protein